jgi:hypothetical protein
MGGQAEAAAKSKDEIDKMGEAWKVALEKIWGALVVTEKTREEILVRQREALAKYIAMEESGDKKYKNVKVERMRLEKIVAEADAQIAVEKKAFSDRVAADEKYKNDQLAKQKEEQRKKTAEDAQKQAEKDQQALEARMQAAQDEAKYIAERKAVAAQEAQAEDDAQQARNANALASGIAQENASIERDKRRIERIKQQKEAEKQLTIDSMTMAGNLFSAIAGANQRSAEEKKNIARVEAGINTAVAITKALPNPWMVAYAAAIGIAQQVAITNAQFATGTGFAPGGMALVGESGPELVNLPRGARVTNNMQTSNMTTNNSPVTVNVLGSNGRIVETLRASLRSGSGDSLVRDLKMALAA